MNKNEFLNELERSLASLPAEERREIINDFQEHFQAGAENGKTEAQLCEELGDPKSCAAQYLAEQRPVRPEAATPPVQNANVQRPPVRPAQPAAKQGYYGARPLPAADRRSDTAWSVAFILLVLAAFVVYPTACAFMLAPLPIIFLSSMIMQAAPGALGRVFTVSICTAFFTAGLLMLVLMSVLLKKSYKKSSF